jgi:hypothetical protein
MRRSDTYRVKRGDNLGDPEFWNPRFDEIDVRLDAAERTGERVDTVLDEVKEAGLYRLNDVLTPLINNTVAHLGQIPNLFVARSSTSVSVGTGAKTFIIAETDRPTWIVTNTVYVARLDDPAVNMTGDLVSFDRVTGQLVLNVLDARGSGTFGDWLISLSGRIGPQGVQGMTGLEFIGAGYAASTAFLVGDAIRYDGKVWRCKLATTGNPPPANGTSNTWWDLLVIDGAEPLAVKRDLTVAATAANQTVFAIPGGYDTKSILVFLDGVALDPTDYTATNGTSITLATGANLSDELRVISFSSFSLVSTMSPGATLRHVPDTAAARGNLGVYSKAEVDTKVATVAAVAAAAADMTAVNTALATKQDVLGFTPVEQGEGTGHVAGSKLRLGWDGADPRLQVNASDVGKLATQTWVNNKSYITQANVDAKGYATKAEITAANYAAVSWVNATFAPYSWVNTYYASIELVYQQLSTKAGFGDTVFGAWRIRPQSGDGNIEYSFLYDGYGMNLWQNGVHQGWLTRGENVQSMRVDLPSRRIFFRLPDGNEVSAAIVIPGDPGYDSGGGSGGGGE